MATNGFRVKNSLNLTPVDLSQIVDPQAGDLACDINDSNKIKRYDANSSAWTEVGSGGVGGTDIFFVQDFESASLSTFTQTGLTLTQTDPLHGKVSALLTHQAAINQSFKQVIPVDRKFRGETMTLRLNAKSNASAGNVTINIYDETNAANIVASEQLQLSTDTSGAISRVAFTIPETCASISYTITALPEAGSPVTRIDDIIAELAVTSLLETSVEVPVVTGWQGYTPTFQGFGTAPTGPTNIEFEWRQVGENVEIRGKFVTGITTAVEARIGLPAGLTSAGTSLIPSLQTVGLMARDVNTSSPFSILVEPSVSYVNLGLYVGNSPLQKRLATELFSTSGIAASFFASIPCAGLSATTTKTIPLTQSGLVQEADSQLYAAGNAGQSITANVTDIPFIFSNSVGSSISYNGTSITILEDGVYSIDTSVISTAAVDSRLDLYLNGTFHRIIGERVSQTSRNGSYTGIFSEGDVLTIRSNGSLTLLNSTGHFLNVTKQGSLKQIAVSSDQKLRIPTSELRMEGASTRGSTATAIVRFDTIAKLRGDAFTVESDSVLGTRITMKKAGKLGVSAVLAHAVATNFYISRNQANLTTATPTQTECLARATTAQANYSDTISWDGFANIGDVIRISADTAPNGVALHSLNLSFQEQDIAVSVTNTLPQFSESDSSVRLDTANGYGSTNTNIRRFSNVYDNIGSDIIYVDSPTLGASFTIVTPGLYDISYSDNFTSSFTFGITKNASGTVQFSTLLGTSSVLALSTTLGASDAQTATCQVYLQAGDVIRPHTQGVAAGTNSRTIFVISKVGKPNVTGVDVTPFVNVPQPSFAHARLSGRNTVSSGLMVFDTINESFGSDILTIDTTLTYHRVVILKNCYIDINYGSGSQSLSNNAYVIDLRRNGVVIAYAQPGDAGTGNIPAPFVAFSGRANAGDIFTFGAPATAPAYGDPTVYANLKAQSTSDQILTAPETFSTDTAPLTYAGSGTYTLSTLANAPVGTFITFTYAANTNTRTQTNAAPPSQTTADMNANGILLYTRAYNAPSTAAQPAVIAIQIGKGLKGKSLDLYKSAGRVTAGNTDYVVYGATNLSGFNDKSYNENTGILIIDAGGDMNNTATSRSLTFSDASSATSGYLVINASKNPALTGLGLGTVAARAVNTSAPSLATGVNTTLTYDSVKTYDTHGALNTSTGVFTAPESGYYQVSSAIRVAFTPATVTPYSIGVYKNGVVSSINSITIPAASQTTSITISTGVYLSKNDTMTIVVNQTSGGSRSLTANNYENYVSIHKTSVGTGN